MQVAMYLYFCAHQSFKLYICEYLYYTFVVFELGWVGWGNRGAGDWWRAQYRAPGQRSTGCYVADCNVTLTAM